MVVFEDGLPRKDQYRNFGVPETTDDTDSLYQVLTRRLAYLDRPEEQDEPQPEPTQDGEVTTTRKRPRFAYPPQLLVVDGGKPQVEAAARALADAGHEEIALCGIAKRLEEVWMPGEEYPVILPRTSEALYLLQRLRDEAHRFAITYHRDLRSKRQTHSAFDDLPGVGPKRRRALLRVFGSAKRVRDAPVEQIAAVPGIGAALAERIKATLEG
jgi:excinuclease ABC subunit C